MTAGEEGRRTGLTVSSLVVIEGEPGRIEVVVGPTTDLWETVEESGRFVIHVCGEQHRAMAEVFAGLRPSPGGIFTGLEVTQSQWGPVIEQLADRAYCSFESRSEIGYGGVVSGVIDRIEVADSAQPLVYFRGSYRTLQ